MPPSTAISSGGGKWTARPRFGPPSHQMSMRSPTSTIASLAGHTRPVMRRSLPTGDSTLRVVVEQELQVVARLFPAVLSGAKRSTIRWREAEIRPGLMRYVCVGKPAQTTVVRVVRVTSMPLADAAGYLGTADEWPPLAMLAGMREHYPDIELHDTVQIIEHLSPEETAEQSPGPRR